jgi:hypothetical protein
VNDDLKEIRRTPGAGYVGLDTTDAPGWDAGECGECRVGGYIGKDLEECDGGHLTCDDCVGRFDGCPSCDEPTDEDGGEA